MEQRPARLCKPGLQLRLRGVGGAGFGDLGHTVVEPERGILFRLVIGITRSLCGGGHAKRGKEQKGERVFHALTLRPSPAKFNNAGAVIR